MPEGVKVSDHPLCVSDKVDEGGPTNLLPNSWTTFMKARVMCGKKETPVQYNDIKQAFVLTSRLRTGVMYGVFSNAW